MPDTQGNAWSFQLLGLQDPFILSCPPSHLFMCDVASDTAA